jgi:hypothetical protein
MMGRERAYLSRDPCDLTQLSSRLFALRHAEKKKNGKEGKVASQFDTAVEG